MNLTLAERKKANTLLAVQLALLACVAAGWKFERYLGVRANFHSDAVCWVGAVFLLIGGVLFLWSVANLGRTLTPSPVPRESGQLVTSGLYRFCRHPLYVTLLMMGAGWSGVTSSWLSLVFSIALFFALNQKAVFEEMLLTRKYGDAYREYMAKVGRFV
jgi:protein-S-isoprenylcysteine O-methyltransferase Ste14